MQAQTDFLRYGGFAAFDTRDNASLARQGALVLATLTYFDDRDLGLHDFRKLEIEVQKYSGFLNNRRVIALRARSELNYTKRGQTVPFYLKPWMGGPQELRRLSNYRFYDDNLLVSNAEYRWEVFSGLDMALFFDAGQVVADRGDFDLNEMETAAGVGLRARNRSTVTTRLEGACAAARGGRDSYLLVAPTQRDGRPRAHRRARRRSPAASALGRSAG